MSKLESRPSRERAWEYVFWVDLDVAAEFVGHVRGVGASTSERELLAQALGSADRAEVRR